MLIRYFKTTLKNHFLLTAVVFPLYSSNTFSGREIFLLAVPCQNNYTFVFNMTKLLISKQLPLLLVLFYLLHFIFSIFIDTFLFLFILIATALNHYFHYLCPPILISTIFVLLLLIATAIVPPVLGVLCRSAALQTRHSGLRCGRGQGFCCGNS